MCVVWTNTGAIYLRTRHRRALRCFLVKNESYNRSVSHRRFVESWLRIIINYQRKKEKKKKRKQTSKSAASIFNLPQVEYKMYLRWGRIFFLDCKNIVSDRRINFEARISSDGVRSMIRIVETNKFQEFISITREKSLFPMIKNCMDVEFCYNFISLLRYNKTTSRENYQ